MPRQPGSRGNPLPPENFHEEPWDTTDVPFVVPALRTPSIHTACCNLRGLVKGASGTSPAFGHGAFRQAATARPPAGKGRCPSALPTRVPLDPGNKFALCRRDAVSHRPPSDFNECFGEQQFFQKAVASTHRNDAEFAHPLNPNAPAVHPGCGDHERHRKPRSRRVSVLHRRGQLTTTPVPGRKPSVTSSPRAFASQPGDAPCASIRRRFPPVPTHGSARPFRLSFLQTAGRRNPGPVRSPDHSDFCRGFDDVQRFLLVVDDDRHICEAMADYLRSLGHRTETAMTCRDAIKPHQENTTSTPSSATSEPPGRRTASGSSNGSWPASGRYLRHPADRLRHHRKRVESIRIENLRLPDEARHRRRTQPRHPAGPQPSGSSRRTRKLEKQLDQKFGISSIIGRGLQDGRDVRPDRKAWPTPGPRS